MDDELQFKVGIIKVKDTTISARNGNTLDTALYHTMNGAAVLWGQRRSQPAHVKSKPLELPGTQR